MSARIGVWPGSVVRTSVDWWDKIRRAITDNALVFIACFSHASLARRKSYQNQELALAIEQMQLRHPDEPWLIPVRFDDCDIPDRDIGGSRTLASIQRADLFGDRADEGAARLVAAVLRILGGYSVAKTSEVDRQELPTGDAPNIFGIRTTPATSDGTLKNFWVIFVLMCWKGFGRARTP